MADKTNSNKKLKKILQDEESEDHNNEDKLEELEISTSSLGKNNIKKNNKKTNKGKSKTSDKDKKANLSADEISVESIKINKKKNKKNKKAKTDTENSIIEEEEEISEKIESDNKFEENNEPDKNNKNQNKIKSKNLKGNGNLHYLPFKMNYDGYAEVDTFFESLMKKDDEKNCNFKTSFRGRIFNGKRIDTYQKELNDLENNEISNNFGILFAHYKKDDNHNVIFENETNLNDFYVWKFDEDLKNYEHQSFFTINKLIDDLGKLA